MNEAKGIAVNIKNFCYAILDVDKGTYATPVPIPGMMEANLEVESVESKLSGDGNTRVIVTAEGDTTLEVKLNKLPLKDQAAILGRTFDEVGGTVIRNKNDVAPYLAAGFEIEQEDKTSSFIWLYKGKFQQPAEAYQQREEGSVTFANPSMIGTFIPDADGNTAVVADESEATTPITGFLSSVYKPE